MIGAWLEANYAQSNFLCDRAPGYAALGNLSHDLNDTVLFLPVAKATEGEMGIIYSLYFAEGFDELWEVFETQPLFVNLGDRRVDDNRSLRCVHRDFRRSINRSGPRACIFGFCERSAPPISIVKECHANGEPGVVNGRRPPKNSAEESPQIVLRLFGFHKLAV